MAFNKPAALGFNNRDVGHKMVDFGMVVIL